MKIYTMNCEIVLEYLEIEFKTSVINLLQDIHVHSENANTLNKKWMDG